MSRLARIGLAVLGTIVILAVGVVALLKSDVPRQIAERRATAAAGRPVTIGEIDIGLWPPRVTVTDVKVANMEGGSAENMVEVARAEAVLDLSALLRGKIDIPTLTVEQPKILAERNAEGKANWQLDDPNRPTGAVAPDFPIRRLIVKNGWVRYRDATDGADILAAIDTAPAEGGSAAPLHALGKGTIGGTAVELSATADPLLNLQRREQPYHFKVEASAGKTKAHIDGTFTEPLRIEGLAADIRFDAQNAADLYQLTGITLPPAPPYHLDGKLMRDGTTWRLAPFEARLGRSDLRGRLSLDTGGERPQLVADLDSKLLDIKNILGTDTAQSGITQAREQTQARQRAGEPTRPPPQAPRSTGVIPDAQLPLKRLSTLDANVKLRAERVEAPLLPVDKAQAEIKLENGNLRVSPLRFAIGEGTADFVLVLDARKNPPAYEAAVSLIRLPIGEILRSLERRLNQYEASSGTLGGRIEIRGRGESIKDMLASANGHLGLAMEKGRMGSLLIELIGLDAAESLGIVAMVGNKPVPIRCAIAEFDFVDGTMGSRILVIDTTDTNITGEGSIKFKSEEIFFRITPHPKDVTVLSVRSPITIEGTLAKPQVRIDRTELVARLGAAAALGAALTPLAIPLAFVDIGLGKDSDCAGLSREVQRRIHEDERDAPHPGGHESPAGAPR